jgi:SEFIR domain
MPASRVFIGYSHDSDQHRKRVLALANQIREDGIEAWIDQYVDDPEEGWPMWMRNEVSEADRVLLVFTETYARRFLGKEEQERGLGVTFEAVVATQALYQTGPRNAKFRPVVFTEEDEQFIPLELRRFNRYRVDTPEHYQNLLRWLHEAPRIVAPPVGQKPDLPLEPAPELFPSKPDEHRDHTAQPPPDGTRTPEPDKRALEQAKVQRESARQAERAPGFMEDEKPSTLFPKKPHAEQTAPRRVEVKKRSAE